MSVIRRDFLPTVDQYTTIPNAWLRDPNMTRRARGLLVELLSHREGWSVTIESLARAGREGKAAVARDLRELEELGYLRREQSRTSSGFGSMDYVLTDPAERQRETPDPPAPDGTVTGKTVTDDVETDYVVPTNVDATNVVPTNRAHKKNNQEDHPQKKREEGGARARSRQGLQRVPDLPSSTREEPAAPEWPVERPERRLGVVPPERCPQHAHADAGRPCVPCRDARLRREQWMAERSARSAEADRVATERFLEEQRSKQASPRSSEWVAAIKADLEAKRSCPPDRRAVQ